MVMSATYPVSERNKVRRLHERSLYEHADLRRLPMFPIR
jgi:hypothetical protein